MEDGRLETGDGQETGTLSIVEIGELVYWKTSELKKMGLGNSDNR